MENQIEALPRQKIQPSFAERFIEPLHRMRSGVDHLLEDFPTRWSAFQFPATPAIEMTETDKLYTITAELPGVPSEDVELQVDRDMLVLKGEKKEERREEDCDYVISERAYGSFERRIALPADALTDEIVADAVDGMLRISIPRSTDAKSDKRKIEIRSGTSD
ncbi:Hsp20/alpha crystallin family protein [Pontixanthobacter gangjinensis]|uniref:Hsp20 family protein n=1 Tax=Pontixanthobacter gangjinensis TaxID=1028742 RepID=A0A6I4SQE3_9SPHN|nr:Hsp20/alpha crystallin family protein [Pontixanthobacter gangjinensis]MXO57276.1 Hsp20 family protein [Pontixanthobacter gangjinensis]